MRGVRHSFLAVVLLLVCGMASASARVVTATARHTSSVAVPNSSSNPLQPLEESHLPPNPRNGLFVSNNPINLWDPLGLAPDLNLFEPGTWMHDTARRLPNDPAIYEVSGHGSKFGMTAGLADQIAKEIRENNPPKPGVPIFLLVCDAGAKRSDGLPNLAEALADEFPDNPVYAPNAPIRYWDLNPFSPNNETSVTLEPLSIGAKMLRFSGGKK